MFKPDYTHNHRGFNRFAEIPTDYSPDRRNPLDTLPEWGMRKINAVNVKGYYWPKPLDDRVYRRRTEPFNENTQLIKYNAYAKERDPFYNRAYDLSYDREGEAIEGGFNSPSDPRWIVPGNLRSMNVQRPKGYYHYFKPTKEETTNEKLPDNYNTTLVPRAFHMSFRGPDAYKKQSKIRKNADAISTIAHDRANVTDVISYPLHHRKNLQELVLKDRTDPNMSDRINLTDVVHENTPRVHHGEYGKSVRDKCTGNPNTKHWKIAPPIARIRYTGAQARPLRENDYIIDHTRPHYGFNLPKNPNEPTAPRGRLEHKMNTIGSLPPFSFETNYDKRIAMSGNRTRYSLKDDAVPVARANPVKYLTPMTY